MARLILSLDGQVMAEYNMNKERYTIGRLPDNDIRICGIFDDREDARVPALQEGYPKLGRMDELLEFGRQAEIDMLIVALPITVQT